MSEHDRTYAREFLCKIIEDTQDTIRALDAKAGVGIVILGAMVGKVLDQDQIAAIKASGPVPIIIFIIFSGLAIISAALAFKTVFPMVNPAEHVAAPNNLRPPFFITGLKPSHFLRLFSSRKEFARLAETHADYCMEVQNVSETAIEKILVAEVLKLSFIRLLKNDRLIAFAKVLAICVIIFVLLIFLVPKVPTTGSSVDLTV